MSTHPERPTPPPPYGIDPNRPQGPAYYPVGPVHGKAPAPKSTRLTIAVTLILAMGGLLVVMALVTFMMMRASS